jgi:phosphinothricin acetyltransferase
MDGTEAGLSVRGATVADIPAITSIYAHAVANTVATLDTDEPTIASQTAWFHHHDSRHPVLVAEQAGEVIGWASLSEWSPKLGYRDTAEASVYVSPRHHGKGIGTLLLCALVERARAIGLHAVIGRISSTNEVSLRLTRQCGFSDVGTMHEVGEKFGHPVDVVILELVLRR